MASQKKRSSCSMTVMLLTIMKSLNISSALCCCLGNRIGPFCLKRHQLKSANGDYNRIGDIDSSNKFLQKIVERRTAYLADKNKKTYSPMIFTFARIYKINIQYVHYRCWIEFSCLKCIIHNDRNSLFSTMSKTNMDWNYHIEKQTDISSVSLVGS